MRFLLVLLAVVLPVLPAQAKGAYDKDYVGETEIYNAKYEDTLIHLARNNGLGFVELRAANPTLDPWIPGAGVKITIPTQHLLPDAPRKDIVINLAEMRVYYFKTPGEPPLTYPISIGREGLNTPTGKTSIVRKVEGPTWRPTDRMRKEDPTLPASVPPGPDNPMGTHAMYLGWPQYAMHGTNKPYGVGRRTSSGCIRMYPEDIIKLFPQVPIGTSVLVVDQPVKAGWVGNEFFVEVSPTQEQSLKIEEEGVLKSYEITAADMKYINHKAGPYADKIDWARVREAVQEHRGYPVSVLMIGAGSGQQAQKKLEKIIDKIDSQSSAEPKTANQTPKTKEVKSTERKPVGKSKVPEKQAKNASATEKASSNNLVNYNE
jgi:L,D-transpeptidase ErfK/SrfK